MYSSATEIGVARVTVLVQHGNLLQIQLSTVAVAVVGATQPKLVK